MSLFKRECTPVPMAGYNPHLFDIGEEVELEEHVRGHFDQSEGVERRGRIMDRVERYGQSFWVVVFEAPEDYIQDHGWPRGEYRAEDLKFVSY